MTLGVTKSLNYGGSRNAKGKTLRYLFPHLNLQSVSRRPDQRHQEQTRLWFRMMGTQQQRGSRLLSLLLRQCVSHLVLALRNKIIKASEISGGDEPTLGVCGTSGPRMPRCWYHEYLSFYPYSFIVPLDCPLFLLNDSPCCMLVRDPYHYINLRCRLHVCYVRAWSDRFGNKAR